MSIWNQINIRRQQVLQGFGEGLNTFNDPIYIKDNEMTDCLNLCNISHPSIQTRADRKLHGLAASTNTGSFNTLGIRTTTGTGTQIHKVFGNTWAYGLKASSSWTNISTSLGTGVYGKIVEFNTMVAKYSILANSDGTFYNSYWDGATWSTFASTASPRSHLMTAHKYRLYGVDNNGRLLRYSAQGDITDWTTVEDAGWIDLTDQVGKASAITTFSDHVIIWSDKTMYELYGSNWDNYSLVNISNKMGCVGSRAYTECNGKLFWMDYNGIYMYTGGQPRQIAFQAKKYIDGIDWSYKELITAGAINSKIYFNIPYQSTANNRIVIVDISSIDQGLNKVFVEDGNFGHMVNCDEWLLAYKSTEDRIYNIASTYRTGQDDGSTSAINWMLETKVLKDQGLNINTGISDIWIEHEGSTSNTMSVGYWGNSTASSTSFTSVGASSDFNNQSASKIRRSKLLLNYNQLQNIDLYKLQLSGTGFKKIHGMQINMYSYGGA